MNIFKVSYKVVRENSDEIYKGFGFNQNGYDEGELWRIRFNMVEEPPL